MTDSATLVIVEDDPEIRSLLAGFLRGEGFRVDCVEGGAALDGLLARGPAPDLVVLDWMMPGEDGLSICHRLRAAGGPPVIMLTAKDEDIDRVLGLEIGADDYVSSDRLGGACFAITLPRARRTKRWRAPRRRRLGRSYLLPPSAPAAQTVTAILTVTVSSAARANRGA